MPLESAHTSVLFNALLGISLPKNMKVFVMKIHDDVRLLSTDLLDPRGGCLT